MPVRVAHPSAETTYQHLFPRGAMPIAFECPRCKKEQRAQDHLKGRELKCAKCGSLFKVPAIGTGNPPARFVEDLYSGPKKAPVAVPLPPAPPGAAPPPAAKPLPAAAAAFEQELVLSDDMIVDAPKPGAAPAKRGAAVPEPIMELTEDMVVEEAPAKKVSAGKPVEEELLLTEDMIVEETPANAAASPADLALLDEILKEETAPPKPPAKKK
jgi:hypothetical protein